MNTVLSCRAVLRVRDPASTAAWLARVLDLPSDELDPADGRFQLDAGGNDLLVEAAGNAPDEGPALELQVVDAAAAVGRCEAAGARVVSGPAETPLGRAAVVRLPEGPSLRLFEARPLQSDALPLGAGPVRFTVGRTLASEAGTVFAALTRAEPLSQTFLHRASGDLDGPGEVEWWWTETARGRLLVEEVEPGQAVRFNWHAHHVPYRTRVRLDLSDAGGGLTRAAFTESGWDADAPGLSSAFAHAEGWTELLAATEAWLLHGVGLKPRRRGASCD